MKLANFRFFCKKRRLGNIVIVCVSFCLLLNLLIIIFHETKSSPRFGRILTRSKDWRIYTKLRRQVNCPSKIPLLILVSSNLGHFNRRHLIRNTWGPDNSLIQRWRTVFLLTENDNEKDKKRALVEQAIYGDVITGDYKESFYNMAFKVAMGFEWALKFCKFDFLLKTDDDIFVNTHGLLNYLNETTTPKKKLYTGNPMIGSPVLREGRYAVKYETGEDRDDQLNKTMFAPYCSGGGFLLSADVVSAILDLYDLEHPLNIDDAYIGELAERAHITMIVNSENFKMYEDSCRYKPEAFVQHPAKDKCLQELHRQHVKYIMTGELETPAPTKPPTRLSTAPLAIKQFFKSSSQPSSIPSNKSLDRQSRVPGNESSSKLSSFSDNRPSERLVISSKSSSDRPVSVSNRPSDRPSSIPGNEPSDRPSSVSGIKPSDKSSSISSNESSNELFSVPRIKPSDRPSSVPGIKPSSRLSSVPGNEKPDGRPSKQVADSSMPSRKSSERPNSSTRVKPSDRPST